MYLYTNALSFILSFILMVVCSDTTHRKCFGKIKVTRQSIIVRMVESHLYLAFNNYGCEMTYRMMTKETVWVANNSFDTRSIIASSISSNRLNYACLHQCSLII